MQANWKEEVSKRILWLLVDKARCRQRIKNFLASRPDMDASFSSLCTAIIFTKSKVDFTDYETKVDEMGTYVFQKVNVELKQKMYKRILVSLACIGINIAVVLVLLKPPLWFLFLEPLLLGASVFLIGQIRERNKYNEELFKYTQEWIAAEERKLEKNALRLIYCNNQQNLPNMTY